MKHIKLKNVMAIAIAFVFVGAASANDPIKHTQTLYSPTSIKSGKDANPFRKSEYGIRYMPTFAAFDFRTYNGDIVQGSSTLSHGFGLMMGLDFNRHVGFQGELDYYKLSQAYSDRTASHRIDISYINFPLMLSLNTSKAMKFNLNVVAGPQIGFNVGSSIQTTGGDNSDSLKAMIAVRKGDFGFAFGTGLEVALNPAKTIRFDIGYRGFYGLVNMAGTSSGNDSYNVMIKTSRKTNAGYIGFTFLF
ncbi:MAG: porin family protein [Bacteroidota bacterium]|nr:porin family protein [Bacteroidota bacterium]